MLSELCADMIARPKFGVKERPKEMTNLETLVISRKPASLLLMVAISEACGSSAERFR